MLDPPELAASGLDGRWMSCIVGAPFSVCHHNSSFACVAPSKSAPAARRRRAVTARSGIRRTALYIASHRFGRRLRATAASPAFLSDVEARRRSLVTPTLLVTRLPPTVSAAVRLAWLPQSSRRALTLQMNVGAKLYGHPRLQQEHCFRLFAAYADRGAEGVRGGEGPAPPAA